MDFEIYHKHAGSTAVYPGQGTFSGAVYCGLGLAGEAGEVANKIKKVLRDSNGKLTPEFRKVILDELGDVLWYADQLAFELNSDLASVANQNLEKLARRRTEGTIHGAGDSR